MCQAAGHGTNRISMVVACVGEHTTSRLNDVAMHCTLSNLDNSKMLLLQTFGWSAFVTLVNEVNSATTSISVTVSLLVGGCEADSI